MTQPSRLSLSIILTSFLTLFLELALIRYLPVHVIYLGYFANLVLIASLFGIGLGLLIARQPRSYFKLSLLPLLALLLLAQLVPTSIDLTDSQQVFYGSKFLSISDISPVVVLPIVFSLVALTFIGLGERLGKLFRAYSSSLRAYQWDIVGSLLGIVSFSFLSWLALPPATWFTVFSLFFLIALVIELDVSRWFWISLPLAVLVIAAVLDFGSYQFRWTPYYRLTIVPENDGRISIVANGITHQVIIPLKNSVYHKPLFAYFAQNFSINKVLIIGAGTGSDVAAALNAGAKEVTAVEIDPGIYELGRELNPDHPYDDPRVKVVIDDGRQFLKNTSEKYDLIVYALTDSLVLTSSSSSIRLENYLYTQEGLTSVKEHLSPTGHFAAYNIYRKLWLASRLAAMMHSVFGPVFNLDPQSSNPTDKIYISSELPNETFTVDPKLPTDEWPFFYLSSRQIPNLYLEVGGLVSLLVVLCLFLLRGSYWKEVRGHLLRAGIFFSLGAAFSLLETKSITQLALVFGSTWQVNALAFAGILVAVLAAVEFKRHYKVPILLPVILLVFSLIVQLTVPVTTLPFGDLIIRFLLSLIYFYTPIFMANLIFAELFSETTSPELDLGANLLGLFIGGFLEYLSLVIGFASLAIPALGLYLLALAGLLKLRVKI